MRLEVVPVQSIPASGEVRYRLPATATAMDNGPSTWWPSQTLVHSAFGCICCGCYLVEISHRYHGSLIVVFVGCQLLCLCLISLYIHALAPTHRCLFRMGPWQARTRCGCGRKVRPRPFLLSPLSISFIWQSVVSSTAAAIRGLYIRL